MKRSSHVNVDVLHDESLDYHEWIFDNGDGPGFTGPMLHLDAIGRRQPGSRSWRRWIKLRCNNSECPASALVSERHIVERVESRATIMRLAIWGRRAQRQINAAKREEEL